MDGNPDSTRARAVVASDGAGRIQLIAPQFALLDLAWVNDSLGRELRVEPVSTAAVSAVPGYYDCPMCIDVSLFEAPALCLDSELPGETTDMTIGEFRERAGPADRQAYTVAIGPDPTTPAAAQDGARVESSITQFTALRVRQRLSETLDIPPLPEAARRLLALKTDPDFDLDELAQVVETDPSLASRILGWANSAFYSLPNPVSSIRDAIMRVLGPATTMNLALGLCVGDTLRLPDAHVRGLSPFWLQAVYTAATSESLANLAEGSDAPAPGFAYAAGLLGNFGTLVLGHVFPPYFEAICRLHEANRHLAHTYIDEHVIGAPRELFSAALLESWSVPAEICAAVRYQYVDDYVGEHAEYPRLLRLTNQVLTDQALTDYPPGPVDENLIETFALSTTAIDEVMAQITTSAEELDGMAQVMSA